MSSKIIKKNLSDEEMFAGYEEELIEESKADTPAKQPKDSDDSFFTAELQGQVSKALLELKVKLFNQGITDYDLKVSTQDKQILLTAVPKKKKR